MFSHHQHGSTKCASYFRKQPHFLPSFICGDQIIGPWPNAFPLRPSFHCSSLGKFSRLMPFSLKSPRDLRFGKSNSWLGHPNLAATNTWMLMIFHVFSTSVVVVAVMNVKNSLGHKNASTKPCLWTCPSIGPPRNSLALFSWTIPGCGDIFLKSELDRLWIMGPWCPCLTIRDTRQICHRWAVSTEPWVLVEPSFNGSQSVQNVLGRPCFRPMKKFPKLITTEPKQTLEIGCDMMTIMFRFAAKYATMIWSANCQPTWTNPSKNNILGRGLKIFKWPLQVTTN